MEMHFAVVRRTYEAMTQQKARRDEGEGHFPKKRLRRVYRPQTGGNCARVTHGRYADMVDSSLRHLHMGSFISQETLIFMVRLC